MTIPFLRILDIAEKRKHTRCPVTIPFLRILGFEVSEPQQSRNKGSTLAEPLRESQYGFGRQ